MLQVMLLWLMAYVLVGQVVVPLVLTFLDMDRDALSSRGHAVLHLCLDLSELGMTLLILWRCLWQYNPLARGFFPLRWKGPWLPPVLASCLTFPVIDWVAQNSVNWFPSDADMWATQLEQSLSTGDWVSNAAYFLVVSICAPIWEEAIFRGFLLPSLTRYLPTAGAVAASSLLFALCHFRLQTFLPLLMLGVVFSTVFLRCNNLLPSILLHSLWNVYVLANLLLRPGG